MQPWGVLPAGDSRSQGEQQLQQQQQQQLPVLPPRPVTPWDVSSDDMDCSSASSAVDSDASSSQQGPQDPAGVLLLQKLAGVDQDQTASALLCREVLFPAAGQESSDCVVQGPPTAAGVLPQQQVQQAQEQRGYGSSRTRQHNMQLPFFNQAPGEPASGPVYGPAQQQQQQGFGTCGSPSHHPPPLPPQQQPGRRSSMHHAPRQGSPELSRQRLEELRARALASTHQLTCLTQEDLHSLQLGLASRRGSVDSSSSHAPSGLQPGVHQQQQQRAAPLPPALRRHSSHI
jgi:hypothetical protein